MENKEAVLASNDPHPPNEKPLRFSIKIVEQVQLLMRILVRKCIKHKKVENPLVLLCFRRQMGLKRAF